MLQRFLPILFLVLAACASTPTNGPGTLDPGADTEGDDAGSGLSGTGAYKHTAAEAARFVRRYPSLSVGLVNYFDPGRCELISREFSAETVIFRLNNTGDSGPLARAAADRAAEMVDLYGWPEAKVGFESTTSTHIALVKLESIGIPSGAKAGDIIPVRVTVMGDASDVRGGYVYNTPLKNKLGRTVALLMQGLLPISPDLAVNPEQVADSKLMETRDGAATPTYILRACVKLATDVSVDEFSDKIILPLMREIEPGSGAFKRTLSAELVPQVLPQIESKMKELGLPCVAEHQGNNIVVTPLGVRELSLRQVFERLQTLRVTIEPRNKVVIVFDDQIVRIAIYGPAEHRMLIGEFALTVDPFTRNKPGVVPSQSAFRVSCRVLRRAEPGTSRRYGVPTEADRAAGRKPDGDLGLVRLSWSRWNKKNEKIAEGTDDLASADICDVLRFLWTRQMKPPEALGFVLEADNAMAMACELGLNWRKIDVEKLREEQEADEREARNG